MYATAELILDSRRSYDNGRNKDLYPAKLRITFMRKQRLFRTQYAFPSVEEFKKAKTKKYRSEFAAIEMKADQVIKDLGDGFTFDRFKSKFFGNRAIGGTLSETFDAFVDTIEEDRVGTKQSYVSAKNSMAEYRPTAQVGDITPRWLREYETWMIEQQENSYTTVGFYTRAVRAVMRWLIDKEKAMSPDLYPFGSTKDGLYEPPTGSNKKKALALHEVAKIFKHTLEPGSTAERMRDYWVFIYLANGINVADMCRLKRSDLVGNTLKFIREKTKRNKRDIVPIQIHLQPPAMDVIIKHGNKALNKDAYLFPHLQKGMNHEQKDKIVANLIRLINDYMKEIAKDLEIDKPVTTYYARHSFATILRNSNVPISMISEMLGHGSIKTTENYFAGFETEQVKKATAVLLDFKKAKNA